MYDKEKEKKSLNVNPSLGRHQTTEVDGNKLNSYEKAEWKCGMEWKSTSPNHNNKTHIREEEKKLLSMRVEVFCVYAVWGRRKQPGISFSIMQIAITHIWICLVTHFELLPRFIAIKSSSFLHFHLYYVLCTLSLQLVVHCTSGCRFNKTAY